MTSRGLAEIELRREAAFEELARLCGRRSRHFTTVAFIPDVEDTEIRLIAALKDSEALAVALGEAWAELAYLEHTLEITQRGE